ncbi:alanine--glyoxylate aminotransferase family protein [Pelagicoccus sp. SDUM812002]|uniref:pyridoxal-phosphate-dependent aminotransferase family protein n=1 Tax=Pelagicoccus sp. SDUM812002 TaxID=3041266 RepID=UPI00280D1AB6|nr:alanine--glyoxylate aminotransferase family protein [Pelagicoccus sp. SDUM812002]MDQ8187763.1 alanine--glyoxylate aminotransferase family protein [Pelagicoccus sp. SDUM812002]
MKIDPLLKQINPPPRLIMGPGPVNADPRVQRAMSADLLGQYDPAMTEYMNEVMTLYRIVFQTENHWTFLIDGTSRAAIESSLVSLIEKGDKVLVPVFGRFGHLLTEIASRCGAEVIAISKEWGQIFTPEEIEAALDEHHPKVLAICQGDTSTTMNQPLDTIGKLCAERGVLSYVDATASIGGNELLIGDWGIDICTAGLQKCLGGPSGSGPITISETAAALIQERWHVEKGIEPAGFIPGKQSRIQSNYFDLAMLMAYWSPQRLNHHTEATSMLYCARECARCIVEEGLGKVLARHELGSAAMVRGLQALGLQLFGDLSHKMTNVTGVYIPDTVDGEAVRRDMLHYFGVEIGTSFGPLHGKIWRIGAMGYNARRDAILRTLNALSSCLRLHGYKAPEHDAALAALEVFKSEELGPADIEISPVSKIR